LVRSTHKTREGQGIHGIVLCCVKEIISKRKRNRRHRKEKEGLIRGRNKLNTFLSSIKQKLKRKKYISPKKKRKKKENKLVTHQTHIYFF